MPAQKDICVSLIGYRGVGKTSVARILAGELSWGWIDTDDLIEQAAGTSVRVIFGSEGEEAFRRCEIEAVREAVQQCPRVVSVGGGAVLRSENASALSNAGPVIWLTASVETIFQRLTADPKSTELRPALTDLDQRDEIEAVLNARLSLYKALADHTVDTEQQRVEAVAAEILAWLRSRGHI
jgi:shikimate kinase